MKNTLYVTASEIGDYVYCKRGWWLKRNNMLPNSTPVMDAGTKAHESLATQLENNKKNTKIALVLISFGILLVILVFLLMILKIL